MQPGLSVVSIAVVAAALLAIVVVSRRSGAARARTRFAADRGWKYEGGGRYVGAREGSDWRVMTGTDPVAGERWTRFEATVLGARAGHCTIGARDAPPPAGGQALAVDSARFDAALAVHASDPQWRRLVTPAIVALWFDWPGVAPSRIAFSCRDAYLVLTVKGVVLRELPDVERLVRLGEALLGASKASHDGGAAIA